MAVKKTETAVQETKAVEKDTMDTQEKDTEVIHLFKDSQRYKAPVFVGVNGVNYKIQRGVDVDVPPEVAEVLEHSQMQDTMAAQKMAQLEAEAAEAQQ